MDLTGKGLPGQRQEQVRTGAVQIAFLESIRHKKDAAEKNSVTITEPLNEKDIYREVILLNLYTLFSHCGIQFPLVSRPPFYRFLPERGGTCISSTCQLPTQSGTFSHVLYITSSLVRRRFSLSFSPLFPFSPDSCFFSQQSTGISQQLTMKNEGVKELTKNASTCKLVYSSTDKQYIFYY